MDYRFQTERATRDQLIDLLGLGVTYPLMDMAVPAVLKVAKNMSGTIPITPSQPDVMYQLHNEDKLPVMNKGQPYEAKGNNQQAFLGTQAINEDDGYLIWAQKVAADGTLIKGYATYLKQKIEILVGIDLNLPIMVLDTNKFGRSAFGAAAFDTVLPYLNPDNINEIQARFMPYGDAVWIRINNSQEGTEYQLIAASPPQGAAKAKNGKVLSGFEKGLGKGQYIRIHSQILTEDVSLHIAAKLKQETDYLNAAFPLYIRPNPALPVTVRVDTDANTTPALVIGKTQISCGYTVYLRPVADGEYLSADKRAAGVNYLEIIRPAGEKQYLPAPAPQSISWGTPSGFKAAHEQPLQGVNGDLIIPLPNLDRSTAYIAIVQAAKSYTLTTLPKNDDDLATVKSQMPSVLLVPRKSGDTSRLILSALQLNQVCIIPQVKPEPAPAPGIIESSASTESHKDALSIDPPSDNGATPK